MLFVVQLVQITKAQTTYENMHNNMRHMKNFRGPSQAITSALTTGTTSLGGAQVGASGMGPDPMAMAPRTTGPHKKKEGCFAQWSKLLGLDTFCALAIYGSKGPERMRNERRNPFSRGVITNCKDFWCDGTPYFGLRQTGEAKLGGERVNYSRMYETPRQMRYVRGRGDEDVTQALAADVEEGV